MRRTVFFCGEFNRAFDRFSGNVLAFDEIFNDNVGEYLGVLISAIGMHADLKTFDGLFFLLQNGDHVHRGAAGQSHRQQLHRAEPVIITADLRAGTQG